ncbi:hypothetical protein K8I61_00215 [bacterium]|nr:hypothetical protein [bacterium]
MPGSDALGREAGTAGDGALAEWWNRQRSPTRVPILLAASIAVLYVSSKRLLPLVHQALHELGTVGSDDWDLLYLLTWIDFPVMVGAMLFLASAAAFTVRSGASPRAGGRPFRIARFATIFGATFAGLSFALIVLPSLALYDIAPPPDGAGSRIIEWPNRAYVVAAAVTAFAFSIHIAFRAVPPSRRISPALLALFALPFPIPAAWWPAVAGSFPSRWWNLWRPVFLLANAAVPLLAIAGHQPVFHEDNPFPVGTNPRQRIFNHPQGRYEQYHTCLHSYQALLVPDRPEVLLSCLGGLNLVTKFGGRWHRDLLAPYMFTWDEAAFDFERGRAWILEADYVARTNTLHEIDLHLPGEIRAIPLDIDKTGIPNGETIRMVFMTGRGLLAASHRRQGTLAIINPETGEILAARDLSEGTDELWRLIWNGDRGELYVLKTRRLLALSPDDLSTIRAIELPDRAYDMGFDERRGRLLIGFARLMRMAAYDAATFEERVRANAPAGVRPIAIDPVNDLVFAGAVTGVIETRRGEDLSFVNRRRILPWPRYLTPVPPTGDMIVTSGRVGPVVYRYLDDPPLDLDDWLLRVIERSGRLFIGTGGTRFVPDWDTAGDGGNG